jgi:hypothetical protein
MDCETNGRHDRDGQESPDQFPFCQTQGSLDELKNQARWLNGFQ